MLDNKRRRDILDQARASNYEGSVLDLYAHAAQGGDVSQLLQPEQPMMTANTPEQQEVGLREQHAQGNTGASMAFPNVEANTSFNTKGMKVPIDITKYDEQGHLVQSFKSVPPGVESLPTGPAKGTVVETPAYKTGGYKGKYQTGGVKGESHADKARRFRTMRPVKGEYYEGQVANSHSTHLGTYHSTGDTYTASPTITNMKAPYAGYHPQSFRQAMDAGEGIPFDTEEEAANFAGGDWKLPKYPRPNSTYQTGGVNLDTTTSEGLSNYRKAYKKGTLTNMDEDGVHTFSDSMLDEVELTGEMPEHLKGKDWMGIPMSRSFQNQQYMRELYKNNPVAQGAMKNTTGDSGDLWGNIMEGTKDAGLVAASTMAPIPGLGANPIASRLVNSMTNATKAEWAGVKAGYQSLKSGKRGVGALKTLYHGTKLKALPMALPVLGNLASNTVKGKASGEDLANAASVGVNMYNPFAKLSAIGKFGRYAVENSKDIVKTGLSLTKGKYADAASYFGSTLVKNKNAKMLLKTGNKVRKEAANI
tara:strand:+ start:1404 stop:3002 length:1599 start_codon:yes stop_codon:yes gene_type:complete